MPQSRIVMFVGIVTLGLLAWTGGSFAQAIAVQPITPITLSGEDFAFRVEGMRGTTPVGRVLVRVDGRWAEADFAGNSIRPLSR